LLKPHEQPDRATTDHGTKTPKNTENTENTEHRTPNAGHSPRLLIRSSLYLPDDIAARRGLTSFFSKSIIARIAIAIGNITFNRSVAVNAVANDS
jgi:hypothetical protein